MLSYIDSARAGALDAGHAYAAGGRRAPEAENGVLMGGTKADASQRFDDFPGEQPSQGEIERWVRNARSKMTDDQKAVVRGAVPAKLLAETTVFDLSTLPALSGTITDAIMQNLFAERRHYRDYKMETTPDFSDVRAKVEALEEQTKTQQAKMLQYD